MRLFRGVEGDSTDLTRVGAFGCVHELRVLGVKRSIVRHLIAVIMLGS